MTETKRARPTRIDLDLLGPTIAEKTAYAIEDIGITTIYEMITDLKPIGHDLVTVTLADREVERLTPMGLVIRPIEEVRVNAVAVAVLGTVASSLMIVHMEGVVETTVVIGIDVIMSVIVPILRLIGAPGVQVTTIPGDVDTTREISVRTRHRQDLTFDPRRLIVGDRMQRQRRFQQSLQLLSLQLPSSVQRRHTHIVVRLRHHDLLRLIRTPQFPMRRRGGKRCSTPRRKSLLFRWMRCRYRLHIYQCCKHFRSRPLQ
jgi:hypothetical protein